MILYGLAYDPAAVMAVLVTAIHVLFSVVQERRRCPGQARA
jgi:hypothetical protein